MMAHPGILRTSVKRNICKPVLPLEVPKGYVYSRSAKEWASGEFGGPWPSPQHKALWQLGMEQQLRLIAQGKDSPAFQDEAQILPRVPETEVIRNQVWCIFILVPKVFQVQQWFQVKQIFWGWGKSYPYILPHRAQVFQRRNGPEGPGEADSPATSGQVWRRDFGTCWTFSFFLFQMLPNPSTSRYWLTCWHIDIVMLLLISN